LYAKEIRWSEGVLREANPLARSVEGRTYPKLSQASGPLQAMLGRPVSFDEAIWFLLKGAREDGKISDLAGSWDMSDSEAREGERALREGWRHWKLHQSA
jgi:hypothetical protein